VRLGNKAGWPAGTYLSNILAQHRDEIQRISVYEVVARDDLAIYQRELRTLRLLE
jgi:hypothetical protein